MFYKHHAPSVVYLHGQICNCFLTDSNFCLSVLSPLSLFTCQMQKLLAVCINSDALCLNVLILSSIPPLFSSCLLISSIDKIRNIIHSFRKLQCSWPVDEIINNGVLSNASQSQAATAILFPMNIQENKMVYGTIKLSITAMFLRIKNDSTFCSAQ